MKIPSRNDPSEYVKEPFPDYYARWPEELIHIPENVVKTWMWYHNEQVVEFSEENYDFTKWNFRLEKFTNGQILSIQHFSDELEKLDNIGKRFLGNELEGYDTADYMQEHGTFPCPIIVAENAGQHEHHRSFPDEKMLEPYHLIEGSRRLAFIRALIGSQSPVLKDEHDVWIVSIAD
ncbi:hypothetical protein [Vibrio diazotrophicus]|uniref:hypothetical protein n=1 Tax=Vibrio diazotrophicus TaxID=685 RepID=UPI000C9EB3E6|nr:hypothetical protein [Vibrio diazotrophicus]PNH95720.1 hypothetical protein C1O24_13370 [Vibrio diazotrophicus]